MRRFLLAGMLVVIEIVERLECGGLTPLWNSFAHRPIDRAGTPRLSCFLKRSLAEGIPKRRQPAALQSFASFFER
jgi:hypothetical protein